VAAGAAATRDLAALEAAWPPVSVRRVEVDAPLEIRRARRELRRHRPELVIAAGLGALAWLIGARIAGVRAFWIEPRTGTLSVVGRLCARAANQVIVQRPDRLGAYRRALLAGQRLADELAPPSPSNPFAHHPTRRWAFAFDALPTSGGVYLDVGVGEGEFLAALAGARHNVIGLDVHAGYLATLRSHDGDLPLVRIGHRDAWPVRDGSVSSVSLLDTLEHVADETVALREACRVLEPGGTLVVTVPARHAFSFLDPGNVKLRHPTLHRLVYTARHGRRRYAERFADLTDGLRGDLSVERDEHTNYRAGELIARLHHHGFEVSRRDGANMFWRFFQVPQLLTRGALSRAFDAPLRWDGEHFHRANLFLVARKVITGGGEPVAKLGRVHRRAPRTLGADAGRVRIANDLDAPLDEATLADFER